MQAPYLPFLLLVGACLALLPVVYPLIASGETAPPVVVALGLLAMGLAWAGGCSLERRRRGTVFGLASLGVALPLALFLPILAVPTEGWPALLLLVGSGLSALGLVALRRVYGAA